MKKLFLYVLLFMFLPTVGWTQPWDSGKLVNLDDVDVSGVTDGQPLEYNATTGKWEPGTDATGGSGSPYSGTQDFTGATMYMPTDGVTLTRITPTTIIVNDGIAFGSIPESVGIHIEKLHDASTWQADIYAASQVSPTSSGGKFSGAKVSPKMMWSPYWNGVSDLMTFHGGVIAGQENAGGTTLDIFGLNIYGFGAVGREGIYAQNLFGAYLIGANNNFEGANDITISDNVITLFLANNDDVFAAPPKRTAALEIRKQTRGVANDQIVLDGTGAGTGIKFGGWSSGSRLYSESDGVLVIAITDTANYGLIDVITITKNGMVSDKVVDFSAGTVYLPSTVTVTGGSGGSGTVDVTGTPSGSYPSMLAVWTSSTTLTGYATATVATYVKVTGSYWNFSGSEVTMTKLRIEHTATESDDHSFEIDTDAGGYGDIKSMDIDYITGAISAGKDEAVILVTVDQLDATGGDVFGLEMLSSEGSAGVYAIKTGVGVGPIHQDVGSFANPSLGTDNTASTTVTFMIDGIIGNTTAIFENNNEYIIICDPDPFEEMEIVLTVGASGGGIKPVFGYSTVGAGQYPQFTPVDGTNGFKHVGAGEIAWDQGDLTGHAADDNTGAYCIMITRTRVGLGTSPVLGYAKVAATTEYGLDENANFTANFIEAASLQANTATFTGYITPTKVYSSTDVEAVRNVTGTIVYGDEFRSTAEDGYFWSNPSNTGLPVYGEVPDGGITLDQSKEMLITNIGSDVLVGMTFIDVTVIVMPSPTAIQANANPSILCPVDADKYPGGITLTSITFLTDIPVNAGITLIERTVSGQSWSAGSVIASCTWTWASDLEIERTTYITDTAIAAGSYIWAYIGGTDITATQFAIKPKGWVNPYY